MTKPVTNEVMSKITFDQKKVRDFEKALSVAKGTFFFENQEITVAYGKYMLNYLKDRLDMDQMIGECPCCGSLQ